MLIELIKKIQAIIGFYHDNNEQLAKEIKKIVEEWGAQVNDYKMERIKENIRNEVSAARSSSEKLNKVYNQKLKVILDEAKKQVLPELLTKVTKPADYEVQKSNAMKNLDDEGDEINDEIAYMFLKDFIDDYDQMKIFKYRIGKKVDLEDPFGKSTFPKTFGKLNKIEMVLNTFNEMGSIANMLFIYPREDGQSYIMNGQAYSIPSDSYEQMAGEESIISFAKIIEEYAKKIPGVEEISDQTDHETVEN